MSDMTEKRLFNYTIRVIKYYWPIKPPIYIKCIFFLLAGLSSLVGLSTDSNHTKNKNHNENSNISDKINIDNRIDKGIP